MQSRNLLFLTTAVLLGCADADTEQVPAAAEISPAPAGATASTRSAMFVDRVTDSGQIVFVGQDRSIVPASHANAVFVPFSTFSIERDGIPNEFPPPDSMIAMLEVAGVRSDAVVIVGEPIPAGRAFAAFDYLGLGDRTALLDGGPAALSDATYSGGSEDASIARTRGNTPEAGTAGDTSDMRTPGNAGTAATGSSASLVANVREDMIVDAEWVHARLDDPSVAILDARPPAEFSGETPGEGIERPGHIPGARNVFWQTLIVSPDDPRLKDEAALRRIFADAGVDDGDTVVAYCRTGGQASFLYTVARYLGYDVRLYDGSFVDWSRTAFPVEG